MHVASLSPLSVGGLAWSSPEPCYTVVLKATFSLEQDGPLNLHLQQSPVCDEQPGPSAGELFYGSDFAPRKVGVDVVMVGHARGREASRVLPFRVALGDLDARLYAVSEAPSRSITLSGHVLRRPDDAKSAVQVAPRPTATRSWRNHLIASHFDFTAFNTAAPELRLDEMPLDALLRLEGLLVSSERREVLIGDTQPYVFYVRDCRARDSADLLFPACDTVWIDTDRERLVLSWRCEARPEGPQENPFLAVVLGTRRVPPDWAEVRRRLSHARWHEAVELPSRGLASFDASAWAAPAWPPPAPSSHAQAIAAADRRARDAEPLDLAGPPTPRTQDEPPPTPRNLDDSIDTPRATTPAAASEGPPTPRSLDDDAPSTPRTFAAIERTARLPDVAIDEVGPDDFDVGATTRIPPEDGGPMTRRRFDPGELQRFLEGGESEGSAESDRSEEEGDEPPVRRPTEPCPPPDDRTPPSQSSPG